MNSKTYLKLLLASFLLGIGISVVGCGSSGSGSNANPPVGNIGPQAVVNGQTPNNCVTGYITQALDGTSVCRVTLIDHFDLGLSHDQVVARLTPSSPASPLAPSVALPQLPPVQVSANDKLTLLSVSGGWGNSAVEGGYFTRRYRCDKVANTMGRRIDGSEVRNEELPSGLFLSNGLAAYAAFGPGVIYFNEAGPLHLGFNAPAGEGSCFSVKLRFKLERCLDVASLPHKCK
ncbi:MAG: hypothetical protein ACJ763_15910 [Bdellovibrionia bacterium]